MPQFYGRPSLPTPAMDFTSSPLSTPPSSTSPAPNKTLLSSQPQSQTPRKQTDYHPTRTLPFQLSQHIHHYIEESLFTQAFNFLLSISSSSVSSRQSDSPPRATIIPPTSYLSLAATISVHPSLTTRTTSKEKHEQSTTAFRLLRFVLSIAGPVNADLSTAFAFRKYDFRSSRYARATSEVDGEEDADMERDGEHLNSPYAGADSIWARAEDFWAVVGWALNCSCLSLLEVGMYKARWEYWKMWIEFMMDVLEEDWLIRMEMGSAEESLVWQYIELAAGGHGNTRRVLRAIFADGEKASLNEFREVWKGELREPKREDEKGAIKEREKIDVEKELYGDYMDVEGSDEAEGEEDGRLRKRARTRTPSLKRVTPRTSNQSLRSEVESDAERRSKVAKKGLRGTEALRLRMRLLALLYQVAIHPTLTTTSPTTFPDLDSLLHLYVEQIAPTPLNTFSLMILPSTPVQCLGADAHATLSIRLLQRLLESAAPGVKNEESLTQEKLEVDFLPFCAGKATNDANARVSLLLESLARVLVKEGKLQSTEKLLTVLEEGIERRIAKVQEGEGRKKGVKKGEGLQGEAWNFLMESGERMKFVVKNLGK